VAFSRRQPLVIAAEVYDAMISHCAKSVPLASVGILAGIDRFASAIYPLKNAAESRVRYHTEASDLLRAVLDLRNRGLELVAIYHCRPGNAPVPGPTDLRENYYGDLPRVVVSLGEFPTIRVWTLTKRYCDELDWRLQSGDGETSPAAALASAQHSAGQCNDVVGDKRSQLSSVLRRVFGPWRAATRIAIGDLRDYSPRPPEPMWDPALDRPPERGKP
jgi:proteasome lid subunit RPN8/RPN11